jgi:uncharacterized DUF497 family protein
MEFQWDQNKNNTNIKKHGIDFIDAIEIFQHPLLASIDRKKNYGEERWAGIGILKGTIAVIVYIEDDYNDTIRIISVRKATKNESEKYKENFKN